MSLTAQQVDKLLRPIRAQRVLKSQGQAHIAAYEVIAHLTRLFGFEGWEKEILSLDIVHERHTEPTGDKDQGRWWVTYSCRMRLTVKDPDGQVVKVIEDAATGSAQNMPSPADAYDFAIKNAVSYALKRCAKDLGDQFGLSLYNKGQTGAVVGITLVWPEGPEMDAQTDVEAHAPAPLSMGNDELDQPGEPEHEAADERATRAEAARVDVAAQVAVLAPPEGVDLGTRLATIATKGPQKARALKEAQHAAAALSLVGPASFGELICAEPALIQAVIDALAPSGEDTGE